MVIMMILGRLYFNMSQIISDILECFFLVFEIKSYALLVLCLIGLMVMFLLVSRFCVLESRTNGLYLKYLLQLRIHQHFHFR